MKWTGKDLGPNQSPHIFFFFLWLAFKNWYKALFLSSVIQIHNICIIYVKLVYINIYIDDIQKGCSI